jgi:NAD(P)-dependent dehydrogenase (short-subunit alcohol dehydrogenase family)
VELNTQLDVTENRALKINFESQNPGRCQNFQPRTTPPIGRVVGPADVAALAVHLMTNTAVTGATYDIDGGQQFVEG